MRKNHKKNIWETPEGQFSKLTEERIYPFLISFLYKNDMMKDMKNGEDLSQQYESNSFALRVRKPLFLYKEPNVEKASFTIRYCGRSGDWKYSELFKLLTKDTLPKYGFYGFMDPSMLDISYYTIYDLHKLQEYLQENQAFLDSPQFRLRIIANPDNSAYCRFFWEKLPKDIIVKQEKIDETYIDKLIEFLNNNDNVYKFKRIKNQLKFKLKHFSETI